MFGEPRLAVLLALATALHAGCSRSSGVASEPDELVVFAASSLRDVFTELGPDFERSFPGTKLRFNFAGTQELRRQLEQGASADVFASADWHHMQALVEASRVEAPLVFARNEPVLVVSADAEASIQEFRDLPKAQRLVVGTPEVPIGRYALEILERASIALGADFRAQVEARVVSRELNVRQILAKVSLGEADAGIVYTSDARSKGAKVKVVSIPAAFNVLAEYPIAQVRGRSRDALAQRFIDFMRGPRGQEALRGAGFLDALPRETTP